MVRVDLDAVLRGKFPESAAGISSAFRTFTHRHSLEVRGNVIKEVCGHTKFPILPYLASWEAKYATWLLGLIGQERLDGALSSVRNSALVEEIDVVVRGPSEADDAVAALDQNGLNGSARVISEDGQKVAVTYTIPEGRIDIGIDVIGGFQLNGRNWSENVHNYWGKARGQVYFDPAHNLVFDVPEFTPTPMLSGIIVPPYPPVAFKALRVCIDGHNARTGCFMTDSEGFAKTLRNIAPIENGMMLAIDRQLVICGVLFRLKLCPYALLCPFARVVGLGS